VKSFSRDNGSATDKQITVVAVIGANSTRSALDRLRVTAMVTEGIGGAAAHCMGNMCPVPVSTPMLPTIA
jgi:hypothetical protein